MYIFCTIREDETGLIQGSVMKCGLLWECEKDAGFSMADIYNFHTFLYNVTSETMRSSI